MPPGGEGLYLEGRLNGGFLRYEFWGAYIWRGLYMEGLIFGVLRYLLSLSHSQQMWPSDYSLAAFANLY